MVAPVLVIDQQGQHNRERTQTQDRLVRAHSYRDCSTVCVIPAIGPVAPRIVQAWWSLMLPMNQKFTRLVVERAEVADAYNLAVRMILEHPTLKTWTYLLTLETDNAPPPDGLLKLIEAIESGPYAAASGLYFTKGPGGQPMAYGRPDEHPKTFVPWLPPAETIAEVNGIGMGFALWRLSLFRKLPAPWFETRQRYTPGVGAEGFTQDLWFCNEAAKRGARFAVDTRVKVGHWDQDEEMMW